MVYESTGSQPLLSSLGGCAGAVLHRRFVYSWSGQPKAYSTLPAKEKHVKGWEFDQKGGFNPKVQVRISPLQIPVFQFSEKITFFTSYLHCCTFEQRKVVED